MRAAAQLPAFGARTAAVLARLFGFGGSGRPNRSGSAGPRALKLLKRAAAAEDPAELLQSFQDAVDLLLTAPPRSFAPELQQPLWTALDLAMRALADRPDLGPSGSRLEVGCVGVANAVFLACLPEGHESTQPAHFMADWGEYAAVFANDLDNIRRLLLVRQRAEIRRDQKIQEPT